MSMFLESKMYNIQIKESDLLFDDDKKFFRFLCIYKFDIYHYDTSYNDKYNLNNYIYSYKYNKYKILFLRCNLGVYVYILNNDGKIRKCYNLKDMIKVLNQLDNKNIRKNKIKCIIQK